MRWDKINFWRALPFSLTVLLIGINLLYPRYQEFCFVYVSYYVMTGLVFLWAYLLVTRLKLTLSGLKRFVLAHRISLGLAAVATTGIYLSVPVEYKVLSDETNLVGISRSMVFERATYISLGERRVQHDFYPVERIMAKRPFLFPYFVHILHLLTGYRSQNVFVLNTLVTFLLLAILLATARHFFGWPGAIASMLLVISQPIVSISATSGGFELLAILFLVLSLLFAYRYMVAPSVNGLILLWIHLMLLCHTRYESCVYAGLIGLSVLAFGYFKFKHFSASWPYFSLTPLFILPFFWQRVILQDVVTATSGKYQVFGKQHFSNHLKDLIFSPLHFDFYLPYATFVNLAALGALLVLLVQCLRGRIKLPSGPSRRFIVILFLCLTAYLGIILWKTTHNEGLFFIVRP